MTGGVRNEFSGSANYLVQCRDLYVNTGEQRPVPRMFTAPELVLADLLILLGIKGSNLPRTLTGTNCWECATPG